MFTLAGDFLNYSCDKPLGLTKPQRLHLANNVQARVLDSGVIVFEPVEHEAQATDLLLSCAIHGNETAAIEICNQLVTDICAGDIALRIRLMVVFANPLAINKGDRCVEHNMNRLFCGQHRAVPYRGSDEALRAAKLEQYVSEFFTDSSHSEEQNESRRRIHFDMHSAIRRSKFEKFAVYPYPGVASGQELWHLPALQLLPNCGINTVLLSRQPSTTFSYFTSDRCDSHSFTLELGQLRPFGENDLQKFQALIANLRRLVAAEEIPLIPCHNQDFHIFTVQQELIKHSAQFSLHVADDVANFTDFPQGTLISEDENGSYVTSVEGECIVFPNANVAIGQRAGLMVLPTLLHIE